MIRRLLPVVLLLTACGTAPSATTAPLTTTSAADPEVLLERWKEAIREQSSVRFEVDWRVEGTDPRRTTWTGVLHLATTGFPGTALSSETTMCRESKFGSGGYHAVVLDQGDETYVEHDRLVLPEGRRYVRLDHSSGAHWTWQLDQEIGTDSRNTHPSGLFTDLDRDTLRLVGSADGRYRLTAGRAVESNPATSDDAPVTLTAWVDEEDRVTRAEQVSRGEDGQTHRKTTVLSDWGAAPEVRRPAPETVADPAEAAWSPR